MSTQFFDDVEQVRTRAIARRESDGNPNVDAGTIGTTLDAQRQAVLGGYQKDLLQLASLLSQSTERIAVSDALQARVNGVSQGVQNRG